MEEKDKQFSEQQEMDEKNTQQEEPVNGEEQMENAAETNQEEKLSKKERMKKRITELEQEVGELKDKNLRIFAEFDNFRKRSAKERIDFAKTAGQDIISDLLPVLDDFYRAQKSINEAKDIESLKEGFNLIYHKFKNSLESKGLKPMESVGKEFNSEIHDAITEIPAPNEEMKGKIVDEVEKGYYLNDKIIRYAKVVVGK